MFRVWGLGFGVWGLGFGVQLLWGGGGGGVYGAGLVRGTVPSCRLGMLLVWV